MSVVVLLDKNGTVAQQVSNEFGGSVWSNGVGFIANNEDGVCECLVPWPLVSFHGTCLALVTTQACIAPGWPKEWADFAGDTYEFIKYVFGGHIPSIDRVCTSDGFLQVKKDR